MTCPSLFVVRARRIVRSSWSRAASISLVSAVSLVACGGGDGGGNGGGSSSHTGPVTVNRSVVQSGPGGSKVKVTLVSYQDQIPEPTHDPLTPKVFGITLRLQNLGSRTVNANRPTYYSVLLLESTIGADEVPHATGPCGGTFYTSRIHLAPHGSAQGCIPYAYGNSRPATFRFGFGLRATSWPVGP
jgi:hypothetical protein